MRVVREQEVNIKGEVVKEFVVNELNKKEKAEVSKRAEAKSKARRIRVVLTLIALFLSAVLWFLNCKWYIIIIPLIAHLALAFYSFASKFYADRNNARAWAAYVKKYGDKSGKIPGHVKMTHRKLIASGKPIKL